MLYQCTGERCGRWYETKQDAFDCCKGEEMKTPWPTRDEWIEALDAADRDDPQLHQRTALTYQSPRDLPTELTERTRRDLEWLRNDPVPGTPGPGGGA